MAVRKNPETIVPPVVNGGDEHRQLSGSNSCSKSTGRRAQNQPLARNCLRFYGPDSYLLWGNRCKITDQVVDTLRQQFDQELLHCLHLFLLVTKKHNTDSPNVVCEDPLTEVFIFR